MAHTLDTSRVPGGRMPKQILPILYFFGPLLVDEARRHRYAIARADQQARAEGQGSALGDELLPARFSYSRLASVCQFELPPDFVIPVPLAKGGKGGKSGGSFVLHFDRRVFSELIRTITIGSDPDSLRLRSAVESEDHVALWRHLFRNFGGGYHTLASYMELVATMLTVVAGIELFLVGLSKKPEDLELIREARQHYLRADTNLLMVLAEQYNVSVGVILAALVVLGGRKDSAAIRAEFLEGRTALLEEALWAPIQPNFSKHKAYEAMHRKAAGESVKAPVGRPPNDSLPEDPVAAAARAQAAPSPVTVEPSPDLGPPAPPHQPTVRIPSGGPRFIPKDQQLQRHERGPRNT